MSSPVRFDAWQLKKPVIVTERNRKKITLSSFSARCGHNKGCLNLNSDSIITDLFASSAGTNAGITFMCWIKLLPSIGGGTSLLLGAFTGGGLSRFVLQIVEPNLLSVSSFETDAAQHQYDSNIILIENVWHHVAVTQDNTSIKFYLDGTLQQTIATTRFVSDASVGAIAASTVSSKLFRFAEAQLYFQVLTIDKIVANYLAPRSRLDLDSTLITYIPCNELQSGVSLATYRHVIGVTFYSGATSSALFFSGDYPPLLYGSSFAAASWDITLTEKFSFKFPIVPPDGTTFALGVRWLDDNGVAQRRFLWELAGVDISPIPALYDGEAIPPSFTLEAYNVDGATSIILPESLILYLSLSTLPITDVDHNSQVAANSVLDTTLAANFPLTPFPLVFNSQQTYP